ncbi:hypothetical protein ACGFR8_27325 [Streptomyces brevispora]|uniref:hypothetical protein n=1 Tax=Streptomyces brevispora TaxID=887462 RepID=UPI003719C6B7
MIELVGEGVQAGPAERAKVRHLRTEGAPDGEPGLQAVSAGSRPTARQNLVPDEAGIQEPVPFKEESGPPSRLHPLQRPRFAGLPA